MSDDLNAGDVVQLISGGLPMTVAYEVDYAASANTGKQMGIHCDWLDSEGRPHQGVFSREQLIKRADIARAGRQEERRE